MTPTDLPIHPLERLIWLLDALLRALGVEFGVDRMANWLGVAFVDAPAKPQTPTTAADTAAAGRPQRGPRGGAAEPAGSMIRIVRPGPDAGDTGAAAAVREDAGAPDEAATAPAERRGITRRDAGTDRAADRRWAALRLPTLRRCRRKGRSGATGSHASNVTLS